MALQSYRLRVIERDLSGFITQQTNENGGMVVNSVKKPKKPIFSQSEEDYILYFGKPNSTYWHGFEAIAFNQFAPSWIVAAVGAGALQAGILVGATVKAFGPRSGKRDETFSFAAVTQNGVMNIGTGDGVTALFTATLTAGTGITTGSLILKKAGFAAAATESGGTITGADVSSGTLNLSSGALSVTFSGTPGTVATVTTTVDFSAPIDFSAGATDKYIKIIKDGTTYQINLGQSASTSRASVISAINTALGYTAASVSGNFIKIDGQYGSSTLGHILVTDPVGQATAKLLGFSATDLEDYGTDPTGAIPTAGQVVSADWIYSVSMATSVSHAFFAAGFYNDADYQLAAEVKYTGDGTTKRYRMTLYEVTSIGNVQVKAYDYSLDKEKNAFGKSIYIFDVFRNDPYVIPVVNNSYAAAPVQPTVATVLFTGGNRGADPLTSEKNVAWDYFKKKNKYPVKIFMDVDGTQVTKLTDLLQNYQPYAFGITMVPPGNDVAGAIAYRQGLGVDFDKLALYWNWATIEDPYNNSQAFVSQVGKIGVKYAQMQDIFDGLAPAGTDENNHGGQLGTIGFKVVELEYDPSETDKQNLDEAQINPILEDQDFGPIIDGDRTLKVINSDTSFIGTRRLYNLMIDNIVRQILRKQVFKLNDELHRSMAQSLTEEYINPIIGAGLLREALVQCDENNNNDEVLNQRQFILDVFVKVTPTSEIVTLRFTRLSQTQVLADFIIK